jgi:hypothetical protein
MFTRGNPYAEAARELAAQWRKRITFLQRIACLGCLLLGAFLGWTIRSTPLEHVATMPAPGTFVVAYTRTAWYKAFVDDNGQFRNAEDGLPLGTVIYWSNTPHRPW